jgi:hypothetical protein
LIRHAEYSRARFSRLAPRLWDAVHERQPLDGISVAGPVDRITRDEALRLAFVDAELPVSFGPLTTWRSPSTHRSVVVPYRPHQIVTVRAR